MSAIKKRELMQLNNGLWMIGQKNNWTLLSRSEKKQPKRGLLRESMSKGDRFKRKSYS